MANLKYEVWDFVKKNFKFLALATIALIFYMQGCFDQFKPLPPTIIRDTVTTQMPQPPVVVIPFQPTQTGKTTFPIVLPASATGMVPASTIDSLIAQVRELSARLEALGREYYATRKYSDSIQLKDTAGQRVGVVKLKQTVSENKLQLVEPEYQLSFPLQRIKETVTLPYKAKNQVFFGGGIQTAVPDLRLNHVDIGVVFKNKRDNLLSLSATFQTTNPSPPNYNRFGARIGYYKLIKINRSP